MGMRKDGVGPWMYGGERGHCCCVESSKLVEVRVSNNEQLMPNIQGMKEYLSCDVVG